jgi:hypothetical protein
VSGGKIRCVRVTGAVVIRWFSEAALVVRLIIVIIGATVSILVYASNG